MKKIFTLFLILIFTVTAYASVFTDLSGYEWAQKEIEALTEKGIINGMGDGTFAPEENVTREQLAKLVMGEFKGESQAIDFEDVTPDMWSYDAISKTNSLFKTDGTLFLPEQDATREETALVITKAVLGDVLEKIKPSDKAFSDIDSIEERKTVQKAVSLGIIEGYPDNTFRPEENVTRAECAVMLYRALGEKDKYTKEESPAPEEEKEEAAEAGTIDDLEARSEFFVVKKVSAVSDSELQGITGEQDGKEYTLTVNKAKVVNQFYPEAEFIKKGDVIQLVKNTKGEIMRAYVVFSPSMVYDGDYVINPISDRNKIIMNTSKRQDYAYGIVRNYKGSHINLSFDNTASIDDGVEIFKIEDTPNVYVYSDGKVYKGDDGDIMYDKNVGEAPYSEDASFVFLRAVENRVTDIYVIENK